MKQYSKHRELQSKADELRKEGKVEEALFYESQALKLRQLERVQIDMQQEKKRLRHLQKSTKYLDWEIFDGIGNHLIASRDGVPIFEIKREMVLYSLKILHAPTQERYKNTINTASHLTRLKNKADKICQEHYIPYEK